jgi:hypothetical protein
MAGAIGWSEWIPRARRRAEDIFSSPTTVVSKLVAGREKDHAFANALIRSRLVDPRVIAARIETVDVPLAVRQRLRNWVATYLA